MYKTSNLVTNVKFNLIDGASGPSMYIPDNFNKSLRISSLDNINLTTDDYMVFNTVAKDITFAKTVNMSGSAVNVAGSFNSFNQANFFTGPFYFNGMVNIASSINSNQYGNGALIVNGGEYIGKDLYVMGNAYKPVSQLWTTVSDSRVKTDIHDVDIQKCIESINNFKIKTYKFNDKFKQVYNLPDKTYVGVIADDVAESHPEAITISDNPKLGINDFKNVNISEQIYELIAFCQHLYNENVSNKNEIEILKNKISSL